MPSRSSEILAAAVAAIGGAPRAGQQRMADAVERTFTSGGHLLVQAGTGTGKSLGYLAPALDYLAAHPSERLVIATATLALQAQLAQADIPAAVEAGERVLGRRISHAILKGRVNYACLHKVRGEGLEQSALLGGDEVVSALRSSPADAASVLGAEVVALREWAEAEATAGGLADRDGAPTHTPAAWAQVSVPVRECLGATNCPYGAECFVEASREIARGSQLIVTNHALLAIDAMHGGTALPEHARLVIDEAHELVARVTGAASVELSPQLVERVARRCREWLDDDLGAELLEVADDLRAVLNEAPVDRVTDGASALVQAVSRVREVSRRAVSALAGDDPERRQAAAAAKEVHDVATAMAALKDTDVLWVSERERFGRWLVLAPLDVAGLLRERVFARTPTVLTSATLQLGGGFEPVAAGLGLRRADQVIDGVPPPDADEAALTWTGLDVGSPFDYARQGILYIADRLPNPGRDGIGPEALAEIAELLWAADGRTLGLFASQRNAEAAARHCRAELPGRTILCQGDAQLSELTRRFVAEPATSLFGTLSLWQGVDVPGDTCLLVIIDKIPFPRCLLYTSPSPRD